MKFNMKHRYFKDREETFTEDTAPIWLTSENTVPGSTMDSRWFWKEHVLTLKVGETVYTDFWDIARVE
jgi:hypothetical protein